MFSYKIRSLQVFLGLVDTVTDLTDPKKPKNLFVTKRACQTNCMTQMFANTSQYTSVLCVGTLFVPIDRFWSRTLENLESIRKHLLPSPTFIILTGYVKKDEHWSEIEKLVESWDQSVVLRRSAENVGKAKLVNQTVQDYLDRKIHGQPEIPSGRKPFDFLLTWDADMVFTEPLIDKFHNIKNLHQFGIVSAMQEVENLHLLQHLKHEPSQKVYKNMHGGIAGGCWFIKYDVWTACSGYPVLGIYAGDDGNLLATATRLGFQSVISEDLKVEHINVKFTEDADWKAKNCNKNQRHHDALRDANQFWNSLELK